MAQATRNLEIISAEFDYLCGRIDFAVRPDYRRYRLVFGGGDGLRIWDLTQAERGDHELQAVNGRRIEQDAVMELIGSRHWNWGDFIACWQGWASGWEGATCRAE